MVDDPLRILAPSDACGADLIADRARAKDPQGALVLSAQVARLRSDTLETRTAERNAVADTRPHGPGYRPQIQLGSYFRENLTSLRGDRQVVWIYDSDIVTLGDSREFESAGDDDPWLYNVDADQAIRRFLEAPTNQEVTSIRLCLFEGTERLAKTVASLGADHLVSHLDLRRQREGRDVALARTFPLLRGLACSDEYLEDLLADGAPELRSLTVRSPKSIERVLDTALGAAPQLRHLGLWHAPPSPRTIEALHHYRVVDRVASVDLWDVNEATQFPFDAVLAHRDTMARLVRLALPGHTVAQSVRQQFADWTGVDFVSHDRRELMALDIETRGWAVTMR